MDTRFHCVYLLTSLDPGCKGDYYIGYTVNPLRRLRQHNGELVNGAKQTRRRGRPWTIVCCVSGFSEDRAALKFEWCWQHPSASARLKHTAPVLLKGLRKLPFAVGVLHFLMQAELFSRLELTLHIFEREIFDEMRAVAVSHVQRKTPLLGRHHPPPAGALRVEEGEEGVPATVLPDLTPTALFHIEDTTRDAFEARYLTHDKEESSALENSSSLCPYDLSVLSQTVLEEWASGEDDRSGEESDSSSNDETPPPQGGERPSSPLPPPPSSPPYSLANGLPIPLRFKHFKSEDFVREYAAEQERVDAGKAACTLCGLPLQSPYILRCPRSPFCSLATHLGCLAMWVQQQCPSQPSEAGGHGATNTADACPSVAPVRLVPLAPSPCPLCTVPLHWGVLVRDLRQRAVAGERLRAQRRRRRMEERLAERLQKADATSRAGQRERRKRARSLSPTIPGSAGGRRGAGQGAARGRGARRMAVGEEEGGASQEHTDRERRASGFSLTQPAAAPPHPMTLSSFPGSTASPVDQLADDLLFC